MRKVLFIFRLLRSAILWGIFFMFIWMGCSPFQERIELYFGYPKAQRFLPNPLNDIITIGICLMLLYFMFTVLINMVFEKREE